MKRKQQRPPRKKACTSCTRSKVRCNLERPVCARCNSLGRVCEYTTPIPQPDSFIASISSPPGDPSLHAESYTLISPETGTGTALPTPSRQERDNEPELDFTATDLVPNHAADEIRDRWLRPYILPPLGEEVPKLYHPFTLQYISRVLSSYPRRMVRDGDIPPIIHHTQALERTPLALANCFTLVRMWMQAAPGSEAIVVQTVQKEMDRLASEDPNLPDITHLSTFQAYLIYSLLLYFSPGQGLVTDKTMITLMELAFRTARHGLLSSSELSRSRPTWESWIVASTKRRAIYVMYLFSSLYNAEHSLPNFVAEELRGVLLPEGRGVWEARSRESWDREYDKYLHEWEDGMMEISELWRSGETGSRARRDRVERWVGSVDEFGMFLFSVCVHLHGC
ncbi:hypothetical protein ASPVEDRAFT_65317 [Aspergillus versicolor CBS 583.65]|uniref:Zn(2)-C6 fungal-type domain-containing protein n=1 Tax=Aspergillus versicolor CBS 583.65 TaxID=1036611 RepID=A0A1L9PYW1_ASPVE|nr:uncharacterized protein ASPVEDRAFT_65317 [Aspergillus versicolor CBS 583.65]OJJ06707.1 hypothetical protein ASPVEDRAFT_65317 [Aspergillus versicolor CBS 583.65]